MAPGFLRGHSVHEIMHTSPTNAALSGLFQCAQYLMWCKLNEIQVLREILHGSCCGVGLQTYSEISAS